MPLTNHNRAGQLTWLQTEGEKRCRSTVSMRKIKNFLNIKAWRHVKVEAQNTNMILKMSIIGRL